MSSKDMLTPSFLGKEHKRFRAKGAPFASTGHGLTPDVFGSVCKVYPETHTCDVYCSNGEFLHGIAWPGAPKTISVPHLGDRVVISTRTGVPIAQYTPIGKTLPTRAPLPSTNSNATAGTVASHAQNPSGRQPNYSAGRLSDLQPGDWVQMNPAYGNYVGVLSGGTTVLKSSDFSQVVTHQNEDVVSVIGRRVEMLTGTGSLIFKEEEGKHTLSLRMGIDDAEEANPSAEQYRVRMDVGHEGDLVNFRLTDPTGGTAYGLKISPDGVVQQESKRQIEIASELRKIQGSKLELLAKSDDVVVRAFNKLDVSTGGTVDIRTQGRFSARATGNVNVRSLQTLSLNGGSGIDITGNGAAIPLLGPLGPPAVGVVATNGSVVFDVGFPTSGDLGFAFSGFRVNTFNGNIRFSSLFGGFTVDTLVPQSVKLGGPPIGPHPLPGWPGPLGAVLYEPLFAFFEAFGALLDTHVHLDPSSGAPTTPPLVPVWNTTRPLLLFARSLYTTFGG